MELRQYARAKAHLDAAQSEADVDPRVADMVMDIQHEAFRRIMEHRKRE